MNNQQPISNADDSITLRLNDEVLQALDERVQQERGTKTSLAIRYIKQGLKWSHERTAFATYRSLL
jgi:hypothetical protein